MASSRTANYFESQASFSPGVDHRFEFQESDIWMISPSTSSPGFHHMIQPPKYSSRKRSSPVVSPSSLPLNIPHWSKIRSEEDREDADNDDGSDEEEADRVPPHEYAARQAARRSGMVVAYSLHQAGTTLKGRDLRRLRNAIWKHTTGFQD